VNFYLFVSRTRLEIFEANSIRFVHNNSERFDHGEILKNIVKKVQVYSQGSASRNWMRSKLRSLMKADYRNTLNVSRFVKKMMNMLGLYLIGLFAHLKAASLVGLRRVLIIHGYSIGQVLSIYIHAYIYIYIYIYILTYMYIYIYIYIYVRRVWATGEFQSAKRSAVRALRNSGKLSLWNCRDSYQVSGTRVAKLISFARKFSGRDIRDPEIPEEPERRNHFRRFTWVEKFSTQWRSDHYGKRFPMREYSIVSPRTAFENTRNCTKRLQFFGKSSRANFEVTHIDIYVINVFTR
jgi:hypothetical protein